MNTFLELAINFVGLGWVIVHKSYSTSNEVNLIILYRLDIEVHSDRSEFLFNNYELGLSSQIVILMIAIVDPIPYASNTLRYTLRFFWLRAPEKLAIRNY